MRALVFDAEKKAACIQEVPEPACGPGQVKIEVKAAGICGTDLHIMHGEYASARRVVLGHEFAGVVAEVGDGVDQTTPGERVMAESAQVICGRCRFCREGRYNLCNDRMAAGVNLNGGFARFVVVKEATIHALPDEVDFCAGAITEPLACAVHSLIERCRLTCGDEVLISGAGTVGLFSAQVARAQGAHVTVVGLPEDRERLEAALKLGAARTFTTERMEQLREFAGGLPTMGFDVAVECAGAAASLRNCIDLLHRGGTLVQLGLFGSDIDFPVDSVTLREITVLGCFGHRWSSFDRALALMAEGVVKVDPIISKVLPLTEWKRGFDLVATKKATKVILTPG